MLTNANNLLYASNYQQAIQEYDKVIAQSPSQETLLAALYNKAQAFDGMGQYSSAALCYQKIIDIDPSFNGGNMYYEQGQLYQLAKLHSDSRRAYQLFLKVNPKHAECYFNLGQVLQTLGEQEEALKAYGKATELRPNYSKAYLLKIAILKKLKRGNDILMTCKVALKNEPTDFEILYQEGLSLFGMQRFKQAIQSLNECIRNNKMYNKAYIVLADCYYKSNKDSEALQILRNCLQTKSDVLKSIEKKEIKILMGTIYMNMKQYKPAIDCFREVLSQRPINETVKVKLAICLQEYGNQFFAKRQFSDALTCYNESLKYDNRITVLNNQGLAYQNINNFIDAEKCFNEVLRRQPKNMSALNNLASLYHQMGKTDKSNEIFQRLAKENPGTIELHINNGRNYVSLHKYKEALVEFSKALSMNKDSNNYQLFNDFAVTLERLNRLQEALEYANKANQITKNRSPLFLVNRASILMGLSRNNQAREDFDRAAEQLRNPDRENLMRLGINVENIKYMFNQLNRYAYLMTPINDFKKEVLSEITKLATTDAPKYERIVEKVEKAQTYAMSRIMTQIKKENNHDTPNAEENRQDYNTIVKMMEGVKQQVQELRGIISSQKDVIITQSQAMRNMNHQLDILKKDSNQLREQIREKLRYLPQSINLQQKLDSLYSQEDIAIWEYGKQLYWILNSYLKSYMLISTGIIAKGSNIDRSTLNKAIKSVGGILEYANNIPVIGEFSELISRVCGLFVDMEDEAIIEKVYQMISYNYDTEEGLNNEICESVLAVLNSPSKIRKVREKLTFKPSVGLLENFSETLGDVSDWFSEKKNEFIMHMRGYQKAEKIIQSELAVIDVGAIISIILSMPSESKTKNRVLLNATKKICIGEEIQAMVLQAYKRQNQNIRVSNNSFCIVMRCSVIYDNPILNHPSFLRYITNGKYGCSIQYILNFPSQRFKVASQLLLQGKYAEMAELLIHDGY